MTSPLVIICWIRGFWRSIIYGNGANISGHDFIQTKEGSNKLECKTCWKEGII